ncbi:MAG: 30S ribosomal protein S10 [Alphaproteobacteria bacterium]|nr:30S ribosomal protein S10 [Alphaproteobacteria bacterium]MBL0718164.1 30S ribosomal protein S10 [Alphaproteobacteria bacterium]
MYNDKIKIKLKAFDHTLLDIAVQEIIAVAKRTSADVKGPIPLPRKIEKFTVNSAPHAYGYAKEQFEIRTHTRLLEITNATPQTIEGLSKLNLPAGIDVNLKL